MSAFDWSIIIKSGIAIKLALNHKSIFSAYLSHLLKGGMMFATMMGFGN